MFKFLKEKLASWIKKSKEKIEEKTEEKEPVKQEIKEIKEEIKKEKKEIKKLKDVEKTKKIEEAEKKLGEAKERLNEAKEELDIERKGGGIKERLGFFARLKGVFVYRVDEREFEEIFNGLENLLLENNVALEVVEKIKENLKKELVGKEIKKNEIEKEIKLGLKKSLEEMIIEPDDIIETIKKIGKEKGVPFKILFFGINGAGKTTTIAKFANLLQKNKISCLIAAADTFRAASIEQIQIHANKLGIKVIKHDYGSDPSAVAFDAIKYAQTHKIQVVLIDTAGRMHTKDNLLQEMEKICRVSKPDIKIFVAEAIAGNDATEQAKAFHKAIEIDGTFLSKTDVDEKGGAVISISYITNKPIFYLGTGQNYGDLELFNKEKFIKQLGLD